MYLSIEICDTHPSLECFIKFHPVTLGGGGGEKEGKKKGRTKQHSVKFRDRNKNKS